MAVMFYMSLRTQYENLGDYVIAEAAVQQLSGLGTVYLDTRRVPDSYRDMFLHADNVVLTKKDFMHLIVTTSYSEFVYLVKPGGYKFGEGPRAVFMAWYFWLAKKLFGAKIVKLPHSASGNMSAADRSLARTFDLLLCRDEETLKKYSEAVDNLVLYSPDMAFTKFEMCSYLQNVKSKTASNKVRGVISLRFDRSPQTASLASTIMKRLSKDSLVTYLSQVGFDYNINKSEAEKHSCPFLSYDITLESYGEIEELYRSSNYIVSNRLHVLLLGLKEGCVPIGLVEAEKDEKISSCFDMLGIPYITVGSNSYEDVNEIHSMVNEIIKSMTKVSVASDVSNPVRLILNKIP